MKFKDLKIGQRFTRANWTAIVQKIDPDKNNGYRVGEIDPPTGIRGKWTEEDDEVICVDDGWDAVDWFD